MKKLNFAVILIFLMVGCTHEKIKPVDTVIAAWSEFDSSGQQQVRAIVEPGTCPDALLDQKLVKMLPRTAPTAAFPKLICAADLPPGLTSAAVQSGASGPLHTVGLLPPHPQKILVIGDTGCRLKEEKNGSLIIQACNDERQWPLHAIATIAAQWKPDLIIHVGDYHYREASCPAADPRCEKATPGDVWDSWKEDFFTPAQPLLTAAPWIFIRGNHENCTRGGIGWTTLIDPRPFTACQERTPPFALQIGDHYLSIIDASDDGNLQASLDQISPSPGRLHWILLHRPILSPGVDDEATHVVKLRPALLARNQRVSLVLAGHVHTFSANRFKDGRPPEVISGNSGTALDSGPLPFDHAKGVTSTRFRDFGFLTLQKTGAQEWMAIEHDRDGGNRIECKLKESRDIRTQMDCHQSVGM